ncbi:unnamed protein product [Sympodiomycopsis kandeliae]
MSASLDESSPPTTDSASDLALASSKVTSAAEALAKRQQQHPPLPRIHRTRSSNHNSSSTRGAGDEQTSKQPSASSTSAVQVDEDAVRKQLQASTTDDDDDDDDDDDQQDTASHDQPQRQHKGKGKGKETSSDQVSKKRMTVVMDGEMPQDDQSQSDSQDEAETEADADADATTTTPASEPAPAPRSSNRVNKDNTPRHATSARPTSILTLTSPGKKALAPSITRRDPESPESASSARVLTEASTPKATNQVEEEDDDDDDDDDPEPSLKYQRLKGSLADIVKKDSVSAFATCEKFLALGTHAGMVFILDFQGNLVKGFRSHTASVLDLEIDSACEFVAAAAMDGHVSVSSMSSAEHYAFDFKRPMRTVSLEPGFGRRNSRAFVSGGMAGALVHREKGWLGHKETVMHAGEGPIWTCRWRGNFIAWANDRGVRIFDVATRQKITFITAPMGHSRADLYRCNFFWRDDRTLIIAWADQIKIASIKDKEHRSTPGNTDRQPSSQIFVEVTKVFEMDCLISGIAPYGNDLLILCYVTELDSSSGSEDSEHSDADTELDASSRRKRQKRRPGQPPELRIIDPQTGDEKSSDVLSLSGFEKFHCNDYRLVPSHEVLQHRAASSSTSGNILSDSDIFYVVSPHDVILARPRDEKDHIHWLLDHQKYESALHRIEAMGSQAALEAGFDADAIGRRWIHHLVDDVGDFEKAAHLSTRILGRDSSAWEEWVFLFLQRGQLDKLVDLVPLDDPKLSSVVYDMILAHFLQTDLIKLRDIINVWPPELYSTQAVSLAIEDRLQTSPSLAKSEALKAQPWTVKTDEEQHLLMEVLADLYVRNRQPGKSLPYYLRLRRAGVFQLIRDNNLLLDVRDRVLQLMEFEAATTGNPESGEKPSQAIQLLVDNIHSIPVHRVVSQLEPKPEYLHLYLDSLFHADPQTVTEYSDLQVELYAKHDYPQLMHYLRAMSSHYSFEKAFKICEYHDYIPEQVFLLGRVGDNKRALNLIISRLQDVALAINFAKEQNDDDLWEDLLRYSETRPTFIKGLLENVGAEIDPIRLIRRIRNGLEIPGLKDALIKILLDFNLQISLLEGCVGILDSDILRLEEQRMQGQTAARHFDVVDDLHHIYGNTVSAEGNVCPICKEGLFCKPRDSYDAIRRNHKLQLPRVAFLCGHSYHLICLLGSSDNGLPAVLQRSASLLGNSDEDEKTKLAHLTTTTQRVSSVRIGGLSNQTDLDTMASSTTQQEHYGPAQRATSYRNEFEKRLNYTNRLKPLLKARKGCAVCSDDKKGFHAENKKIAV